MSSREKKKLKRKLKVEGEVMGRVEIHPGKKKRAQCVSEFKKSSKINIDCEKSDRVLRSRSSIAGKMENKTKNDKVLEKKKKEKHLNKKRKSLKKTPSKSPNDTLKNIKLRSSTSKIADILYNESSTDEESDNEFLATPKLRKSKRSCKTNCKSDSPQPIKKKSSSGNPEEFHGKKKSSSKNYNGGYIPKTPLEKARVKLHTSSVPDLLPCREKEFNDIFHFLQNKLLDGIGGSMYISGVPGTGKTATVTRVVKKLKALAAEDEVPDFNFIKINGMGLAKPRQAYVVLWGGLIGKNVTISPEQAQRKLDDWFCKTDPENVKKPTVLLVDEFDLLCTRKQDVVYNLLEWPTKSSSRLIVITIANTMDMPERLLKGRVSSRLGLTRLTFLPYTFKQLEEIIMERLTGLEVFTLDAVRLVTRKVAAVSGDARKSLDICRRATELTGPDKIVKLSHMEEAIREMTNSNSVNVLRNMCLMEKLFLRSVYEVCTSSGNEEVDMRDVIENFLALCTLEGHPRLPVPYILDVCNRLRCFRILFADNPLYGARQKLTLNVSLDDIYYGIISEA